MDIHSFLLEHLIEEAANYGTEKDIAYLKRVVDDWLNDSGGNSSSYRLDNIRRFLPDALRILDMGAGCGTFVHHALHQQLDAFGIEPEPWKLEVVRRKIRHYGYDRSWTERIIAAKGEALPFADKSFDCVTTYQTLEHVRDVYRCCSEMVRITRSGGGIYIRCPDYALSTFEGHYRLPWLPGLRGKTAERYLTLLKRPVTGLRALQPVNTRMLKKTFNQLARERDRRLQVVNIDYARTLNMLRLRDSIAGYLATRPLILAHWLRLLFRADTAVHLFIYVTDS